jgi:putative transposase
MYLAIVTGLYLRRIVGWHAERSMTTNLISKAIISAANLRQLKKAHISK